MLMLSMRLVCDHCITSIDNVYDKIPGIKMIDPRKIV